MKALTMFSSNCVPLNFNFSVIYMCFILAYFRMFTFAAFTIIFSAMLTETLDPDNHRLADFFEAFDYD